MAVQSCDTDNVLCNLHNATVLRGYHSGNDNLSFTQVDDRITLYVGSLVVSNQYIHRSPNYSLYRMGLTRFGEEFKSNPDEKWRNIPGLDRFFQNKRVLGQAVDRNVGTLDVSIVAESNLSHSLVNRLMAFDLVRQQIEQLSQDNIDKASDSIGRYINRNNMSIVTESARRLQEAITHASAGGFDNPPQIIMELHNAMANAYRAMGSNVIPTDVSEGLTAIAQHMDYIVEARKSLHHVLGSPSDTSIESLADGVLQSVSELRASVDTLRSDINTVNSEKNTLQTDLLAEMNRANAFSEKYDILKTALVDNSVSHDDLMSYVNDLQQYVDNDSPMVNSITHHARKLLIELEDKCEKRQNNTRNAFLFLVVLLIVVVALCISWGICQRPKLSEPVRQ